MGASGRPTMGKTTWLSLGRECLPLGSYMGVSGRPTMGQRTGMSMEREGLQGLGD